MKRKLLPVACSLVLALLTLGASRGENPVSNRRADFLGCASCPPGWICKHNACIFDEPHNDGSQGALH